MRCFLYNLELCHLMTIKFISKEKGDESTNLRSSSREAYSAAGETGFGWWLVEHYFSYHIDCPDGCDSGESTRGG